MARILCNVAGGGKPLKGNAETGDVLAGKTFSNKQSNALTGSMPNNGAWSASTSGSGSVTIPEGYHNGSGTVSGAASYNSGYTNGHNQGVNDGINSVNIDFFCVWAGSSSNGWDCKGSSLWNTLSKQQGSGRIINGITFGWYQGNNCTIRVASNCTMVSNKGTWNLNAGQTVVQQLSGADNSTAGDWQGYVYAR